MAPLLFLYLEFERTLYHVNSRYAYTIDVVADNTEVHYRRGILQSVDVVGSVDFIRRGRALTMMAHIAIEHHTLGAGIG